MLWGAVGGLLAVAGVGLSFVVKGWDLGISAWFTVPLPAAVAAAAAWGGAREGGSDGIRREALVDSLEPGEVLFTECPVRPSPIHPVAPDVRDPCHLQLTSRRLQLWLDTALVFSRPWRELHLTAEGDDQVIVHGQEGPLIAFFLDKPTTPEELVLAAARLKARTAP